MWNVKIPLLCLHSKHSPFVPRGSVKMEMKNAHIATAATATTTTRITTLDPAVATAITYHHCYYYYYYYYCCCLCTSSIIVSCCSLPFVHSIKMASFFSLVMVV